MRKILLSAIAISFSLSTFAGGIVTNSNQSAQYVRTLSRNASSELDAVYFNPAGLTKMKDGLYLGIHNQSIFQTKEITNSFSLLNNHTYKGDVTVPLFPTGFAAYKMDNLVFSFGFGPNGGGGTAEFKDGLPSFEIPISKIPASLTANGIPTSKYSANLYFNGSSIYWGYQLNASYKINDIISVAGGCRYIAAKNKYEGSIKDIMINPNYPGFGANFNGSLVSAPEFFNTAATILTQTSAGASAFAATSGLGQFVNAGAGEYPVSSTTTLGLPADKYAQLLQILTAATPPNTAVSSLTIAQAQQILAGAAPVFAGKAGAMATNATATTNMDVDATQTATGFTPILGVNITPIENLDIAIKYEFETKLKFTNDSEPGKDANGMFKKDSTFRNDIPAILGIGVKYKFADNLSASLSWTHYFDKDANWEGREKFIDNNLYDLAAAIEYDVNENVLISCGFLRSQTGIGQGYQTDLSYSLTSNTVGFGAQFKVNPKVNLNLGALYTMYQGDKVETKDAQGIVLYTEEYSKKNLVFSIGLDFKIF